MYTVGYRLLRKINYAHTFQQYLFIDLNLKIKPRKNFKYFTPHLTFMMKTIEYLNYDNNVDHLTIHRSDSTIERSIDTGLVVLSLNKEKEIVGIEIMGAHKNFKIPLEVLQQITSCTVNVRYDPQRHLVILNIMLQYKQQERPIVFSYENIDLGTSAFSQSFACVSA